MNNFAGSVPYAGCVIVVLLYIGERPGHFKIRSDCKPRLRRKSRIFRVFVALDLLLHPFAITFTCGQKQRCLIFGRYIKAH